MSERRGGVNLSAFLISLAIVLGFGIIGAWAFGRFLFWAIEVAAVDVIPPVEGKR